ncbi:MAG TPA: LamG domain-containing protein [Chthoniobacteraceae bacterium]|nr:LamG domain-containing protein [Chthoniobacteraceae bacterium]
MRGSLWFLLSLCAAFQLRGADPSPASTPEAGNARPATRLIVDLIDGSRLIGTPEEGKLRIVTAYAEVEIAYDEILNIQFDATPEHTAKAMMHNKDILNGRMAADTMVLNTNFGRVTIPVSQLLLVVVRQPAGDWPVGLVLHFDMGVGDDSNVADTSGLGNNGVMSSATRMDMGTNGKVMSFDGGNQKVAVKNSPSLQLQDFTLALWAKRHSTQRTSLSPAGAMLMGFGNKGYGFGMLNDGTLSLQKVHASTINSGSKVTDGAFHHIVVTKKGKAVVFYLDGVANPAGDFEDVFEFDTDFSVGGIEDTALSTFIGQIRDAAVYNRALSTEEVKDLYERRK